MVEPVLPVDRCPFCLCDSLKKFEPDNPSFAPHSTFYYCSACGFRFELYDSAFSRSNGSDGGVKS